MTMTLRKFLLVTAILLGIPSASGVVYPAYFLIKKVSPTAPADLAWTDTVALNVKTDSTKFADTSRVADTALFCKSGGGASDTAKYAKKSDTAKYSVISDSASRSTRSRYSDSSHASIISDSSKALRNYARSSALSDTAAGLRAYTLSNIHDSILSIDSVAKAHFSDTSAWSGTATIAVKALRSDEAYVSDSAGIADSAKTAHKADTAEKAGVASASVYAVRSDSAYVAQMAHLSYGLDMSEDSSNNGMFVPFGPAPGKAHFSFGLTYNPYVGWLAAPYFKGTLLGTADRSTNSAHAALSDSSIVSVSSARAAYADSALLSRTADTAKELRPRTPRRYLFTDSTGHVAAGGIIDSGSVSYYLNSAVFGTQSGAATVGVNARNNVITGFYMMDAGTKRWEIGRGALSDSLLFRSFSPSGDIQDTVLACGPIAGDTLRMGRPTKFPAGLRGRLSGKADSALWAPLDSGKVRGIIHDSMGAERHFDTLVSRSVTHDSLALNSRGWLTANQSITWTGSGDVTGSASGTTSISPKLTLASIVTAGSAGSATTVPTLTWDAKGRLTAAGSATISIPHTQINDWAASVSSVYLPLTGGTMTAGAKILALQDMTINTGANVNYSSAPFVAQRNTIGGTTTHASIGFHNRGVNAAALFYHAGYSNFWFNDHTGGLYQLWSSKDFASQSITNWTTAYNWGNHASAGYLLSSTASSTYQPLENQRLSTSNSPTFGQLHIGSVDNPLIRLVSDGSINMRAIAGHEFVVATPTDPYSSDGLSLMFSGSEGDPVAIKAGAFYASDFYEGGVALSSKYLQANQSISLTGAVTGSGTTSIATSFANTHLAGINQELATTSSPTFANATIHGAQYTVNSIVSSFAAIYGSATDIGHLAYTWALDGSHNYINASNTVHLDINGVDLIALTSTAFAVKPASTFTGLITANGGITGDLTGHASLDIPLTGSSAITGSLNPIGSTYEVGSSSAPWGEVHALAITANTVFYGNRLESTGNVLSLVGGAIVDIDINQNQSVRITGASTTIYNATYLSGTFTPTIVSPGAAVTIDATYQGKMVSTGRQVNLPTTGPFVGFWFYLSWNHDAYQGWGPSGTWTFRGVSTTGAVTEKFSGIVSWTGSEWIAG